MRLLNEDIKNSLLAFSPTVFVLYPKVDCILWIRVRSQRLVFRALQGETRAVASGPICSHIGARRHRQ
jgi:hypothetical protein